MFPTLVHARSQSSFGCSQMVTKKIPSHSWLYGAYGSDYTLMEAQQNFRSAALL